MTAPFRLSKAFVETYAAKKAPFGFGGLGELVYLRTYSRIKPDGSKEKWHETVERVVNGTYTMQKRHIESQSLGWDEEMGRRSAEEMYERMWSMKFLPPGRGLWAMGSPVTEERGLYAALNNCGFTSTENIAIELAKPFTFLMDMSMLGLGLGYDVKGAGKIIIQQPDATNPQLFTIPDTREGWVEALGRQINSYFISGSAAQTFDYSQVREAGMPIKGFGGVSSGSAPLKQLLADIDRVLGKDVGRPISITSIVDIMNLIGVCVISGNVRRSAEISFGPHDSEEFINLKNYELNPDRAAFGWASNNSVFAEIGMDYSKLTKQIAANGEPGLAWLENMQNYGRMNGVVDRRDHRVRGGNPCVSANTRILTNQGLVQVRDLLGKQFTAIVDGRPYLSTTKGFWQTAKEQQLFRLELDNGLYVRCTDNHQILQADGQWCEAGKLQIGTEIQMSNNTGFKWQSDRGTFNEGYVMGQLIGDGTFYINKQGLAAPMIAMWLDSKYEDRRDYEPLKLIEDFMFTLENRVDFKGFGFACTTPGGFTGYRLRSRSLREMATRFNVKPNSKKVPEDCSYEFTKGLLSGFYDADGTVTGTQAKGVSVRLAQVDVARLEAVQRLLFSMGIVAKIFKNRQKEGMKMMPDGRGGQKEYLCQTSHDLIIANESLFRFRDIIGFSDNDKKAKLDLLLSQYKRKPNKSKFHSKVLAITPDGCEDVYDATIPGISRFSANGIVVHNCLEQSLEGWEVCCLAECFPANHSNIKDFLRTLKFAYLYAKTVTLGKTHWPETNRVMLRNRRIGCSQTGIAQFIAKHDIETFRQWCQEGYEIIQHYDEIYSNWLCCPRSIKTTSVKPSGTVSLLAGATPGLHYPESRFYIRRMRLAVNSDLIGGLRASGYHIEPAESDPKTMVVSFPVDCGEGIRTVAEVSMWEQLALVAFLQEVWADNQVSATITFDPVTEGHQIAHALNFYQFKLKGISFLPRLALGAYKQMPYESITQDVYNTMVAQIHQVTLSDKEESVPDKYCDGVSCSIR